MAKIIFNENKSQEFEFKTLVTIAGDPHEFEPSTKEVKNLIKAPILISGPNELNPWIKKINYQRSKITGLKTINVQISNTDYSAYPRATHEALSHFWLYPKIFCTLKTRMEEQFVSLKMLSKKNTIKDCLNNATLIENELRETLKSISMPIILTHDALLPLLESVNENSKSIVAIKGSGHHQEASTKSVKKLYDALKSTRAIWVEELGIKVPSNILNKKRANDLSIQIDTANTQGLGYFQVLQELNDKLRALIL